MARARRLDAHPLTRIERGDAFTFHHEGRAVPAYEGESVAAALYAAGRTALSRSMRYHRARGLFCGTGGCTHCLLRIDGQPNQRACQHRATSHTWSEDQNSFPDAEHDLLAVTDVAYPRYLDAHRTFARPAPLRAVFLPIARRMAGFGRVPKDPVPQTFLRNALEPELLVVGAGPAGLAAADAATGSGARVVLLDAGAKAGGRLRALPTPFHASRQEHAPRVDGKTYADEAEAHLRRHGVDVRLRTRVVGRYDDGRWIAATPTTLLELRPQRVVLAPGAIDAYPVVPGADRAGVLLPTAALQLLNVHGIAPADPVVLLGATRESLLLARDLVACGVRVAGVFDPRPAAPTDPLLDDVRRLGIGVQFGHRVAFVVGRKAPHAVVFAAAGGRVRVACGTLVAARGRVTHPSLLQQAGAELQHAPDRGGWVPHVGTNLETTVKGLYVAGAAAGVEDEWSSVLRGRIAGAAAALSLAPEDAGRRRRFEAALDAYGPANADGALAEATT